MMKNTMNPESVIHQLHGATRQVNQSGIWHDEQLRLAQFAMEEVQKMRQRIAELEQQVENGNADS